jgi:hypothetical protein
MAPKKDQASRILRRQKSKLKPYAIPLPKPGRERRALSSQDEHLGGAGSLPGFGEGGPSKAEGRVGITTKPEGD